MEQNSESKETTNGTHQLPPLSVTIVVFFSLLIQHCYILYHIFFVFMVIAEIKLYYT
jgi:hypothetical protein